MSSSRHIDGDYCTAVRRKVAFRVATCESASQVGPTGRPYKEKLVSFIRWCCAWTESGRFATAVRVTSIDSSVSPALPPLRQPMWLALVSCRSGGNASTRGGRVNAEHQCARSTSPALMFARQRLWESPARRGEPRRFDHRARSRGAVGVSGDPLSEQSAAGGGRCAAGDPQAVNVWAGSGFQRPKSAPVAEIVKSLT